MTRKWISTLGIATMASLVSLGNALADERTPTAIVTAWDLDLGKPGDVQTLYERLHTAAADICQTEAQRYYRQTRMRAPLGWRERCVKDALRAAVRGANNPSLAALHD